MDAEQTGRLTQAIASALCPLSEARAALLFGSRATGRARTDSDVDVAVLLDTELAPRAPKERLGRLIVALATEISAERLDVVILNDAPPVLAFQVLKHGVVAFERDARDLLRLRIRVYSAHADYAPVERLFREATRRRLMAAAPESDRG